MIKRERCKYKVELEVLFDCKNDQILRAGRATMHATMVATIYILLGSLLSTRPSTFSSTVIEPVAHGFLTEGTLPSCPRKE